MDRSGSGHIAALLDDFNTLAWPHSPQPTPAGTPAPLVFPAQRREDEEKIL
jgi:hypothetical protein